MALDVSDLRSFYGDRLGTVTRRLIGVRLKQLWPSVAGERVLGLGYAVPYLSQLGDDAERRLAFMPAEQGVLSWPSAEANAAALVLPDALPLPEAAMDKVLLVHCLELAESERDLLREVWRVLAPGGRLIIIVPNRAGIWARVERTPFGNGRPFSRGQLSALLRETMFVPMNWSAALAMPPLSSGVLLQGGTSWERVGAVLWPRMSGVHILEATKVVQRPVEVRKKVRSARVRRPRLAAVPGLKSPGAA